MSVCVCMSMVERFVGYTPESQEGEFPTTGRWGQGSLLTSSHPFLAINPPHPPPPTFKKRLLLHYPPRETPKEKYPSNWRWTFDHYSDSLSSLIPSTISVPILFLLSLSFYFSLVCGCKAVKKYLFPVYHTFNFLFTASCCTDESLSPEIIFFFSRNSWFYFLFLYKIRKICE